MTADFVAIPDEAALASWPEDACSTLRRGRTARYGLPLRSHAPSPMVSRPSPRASIRLVLARCRSATPSCAAYAHESRARPDRRPRCVPPHPLCERNCSTPPDPFGITDASTASPTPEDGSWPYTYGLRAFDARTTRAARSCAARCKARRLPLISRTGALPCAARRSLRLAFWPW
ncbi:hypothetical protein K523DRAFT_148892 [Schizophyllum commune Tattone D]|nr:hypothetical protein K523DRAFT_148892 [Schizophyllum commune Tattone D]